MKSDYSRKGVAALAAFMLACAVTTGTVNAVDTTAPETETTESAATTAADIKTSAVNGEKDGEWFKAGLDEYDDSLSLISYRTSPEAAKSGKKNKSKDPKPVELNVTGGYVGDIPFFESEPVIESRPGQFAVVTYGWGHGVGMSQNGANFYATYSGWTYQDILFHYFPDTYLMDTGMAYDEEITVAGVSGDVLSMVSQIVYNEIGGSMSYEAMKAQAVAVYTYCKYNGNDSSDLRCKPNPPQVVVDAVSEVLGQALYYDGDYALTMFSASSGGVTANCYEVFWKDLPYLRSVSSDYDGAYDPHYGTVTYIDDFQFRNMIQSAYGIKLSDDPYNWVKPEYSDSTGYVTYVNIDDQLTVKGYEFKLAIGLKSSKFNLYYTPRPDGEKIPDGSSDPVVVDPDYNYTPGVNYPNSYPSGIGTEPQYPEEYPTDPPEWYDPSLDDPSLGDPSWSDPSWTDPEWSEPTWSEPQYSDGYSEGTAFPGQWDDYDYSYSDPYYDYGYYDYGY